MFWVTWNSRTHWRRRNLNCRITRLVDTFVVLSDVARCLWQLCTHLFHRVLQTISQELTSQQPVIDSVDEKGKTLQSPTVSSKLENLKEQYKHLCKVVQVKLRDVSEANVLVRCCLAGSRTLCLHCRTE